jgi:hypothetical protein
VAQYRRVLDQIGPYAGPCETCCRHPDGRHVTADAIARDITAGQIPEAVAAAHLPAGVSPAQGVRVVHAVTIAVLRVEVSRFRVPDGRAHAIDVDVWAAPGRRS